MDQGNVFSSLHVGKILLFQVSWFMVNAGEV